MAKDLSNRIDSSVSTLFRGTYHPIAGDIYGIHIRNILSYVVFSLKRFAFLTTVKQFS